MEILTEAKEGHQNLASTLLQESMEQAGKYYCKHVKSIYIHFQHLLFQVPILGHLLLPSFWKF
jgi:hypothetical protein